MQYAKFFKSKLKLGNQDVTGSQLKSGVLLPA